MYQKEIIYLTLRRQGEKLGNAGYIRVENREGKYYLSMQIQNLPESVTGVFGISVYREEGWEEIDTITIKRGKGTWQKQNMHMENGVWLRISIGEGYLLGGKSKYVKEPEKEKPESAVDIKREQNPKMAQKQETRLEQNIPEKLENIAEKEMLTVAELQNEKQQNVVKEDKWQQILETYDTIHPYGDERIYVKIEPKDFIILQGKYQHLVNNSFLLHGFYNYRYLILGKEGDFYLGVPGVYYEREKMVAVMFGFEAFECEGGHANPGDFGYYLKKVEL